MSDHQDITEYLRQTIERGGSDLHISANAPPAARVNGAITPLEDFELSADACKTLIMGTLHTVDAPQTIDRLVDVFPPDQQQQIIAQLGNVLSAIITQRLLPKADGSGRVVATEVLRMNYALRNCVRDRKIEQIVGLMEVGRKEGMHTIDDHLEILLAQNLITRDEVFLQCRDQSRFQAAE